MVQRCKISEMGGDNLVDTTQTTGATFKIYSTNFYVPVTSLSINDNIKILENTKQASKRMISWNKYRPGTQPKRQQFRLYDQSNNYMPLVEIKFSIHHPVVVKLLVRLRLGCSHLRAHKFWHSFHDTLNLLCSCSLEPETNSHYLLCCRNFSSALLALMNDLNLIDPTISQLNETALANILLYGDSKKIAKFCRVLSSI